MVVEMYEDLNRKAERVSPPRRDTPDEVGVSEFVRDLIDDDVLVRKDVF